MKKEKKTERTIPFRLIFILLVIAAVLVAVFLSGPTDDTASPIPATPTPLPTSYIISPVVTEESLEPERNPTDGVILASVVVVIIVCVGTLFLMRYPSQPKTG